MLWPLPEGSAGIDENRRCRRTLGGAREARRGCLQGSEVRCNENARRNRGGTMARRKANNFQAGFGASPRNALCQFDY